MDLNGLSTFEDDRGSIRDTLDHLHAAQDNVLREARSVAVVLGLVQEMKRRLEQLEHRLPGLVRDAVAAALQSHNQRTYSCSPPHKRPRAPSPQPRRTHAPPPMSKHNLIVGPPTLAVHPPPIEYHPTPLTKIVWPDVGVFPCRTEGITSVSTINHQAIPRSSLFSEGRVSPGFSVQTEVIAPIDTVDTDVDIKPSLETLGAAISSPSTSSHIYTTQFTSGVPPTGTTISTKAEVKVSEPSTFKVDHKVSQALDDLAPGTSHKLLLCKSFSQCTRAAMDAVFSGEEMELCSVTGRTSGDRARPPLPEKRTAAILHYVSQRFGVSDVQTRSIMAQKLKDNRSRTKKIIVYD